MNSTIYQEKEVIFKKSGKHYLSYMQVNVGSKEYNDKLMSEQKPYYTAYNKTLFYCKLLKNGMPFGGAKVFTSDQVEIL